jgi:hypothetical protein
MNLTSFSNLRPYLYHLTASRNLPSILLDRRLDCATELLGPTAKSQARIRRSESLAVESGGKNVVLRDQRPLHPGNCDLQEGWSFEDFVEHLNSFVYFWPGKASKPVRSGINHFARYQYEDAVVLKVRTVDLISANPNSTPRVSRVNSGAPRWSGGRASPRGSRTFLPLADFDGTASDVVEFVFEGRIHLPPDVDVLRRPEWITLVSS